MYRGLYVVPFLLVAASAGATELAVGGAVYRSACVRHEWKEIRDELISKAAGKNEAELVSLVHTYLCGAGVAAQERLLAAAPKRVAVRVEGTGESAVSKLADRVSAIEPQGKQAWSVTVQAEALSDIAISFRVNEACIRNATLRNQASRWFIVGVGEACD